MRSYTYLCDVTGPLTETVICRSSGNKRRFFLCKNRNSCLKISTIVELFRAHREHPVKQPSAAAETKPLASIPPTSCFTCPSANSSMEISLERKKSTDRTKDISKKLNRFACKFSFEVSTRTTYSVSSQAGHGIEEAMRSNLMSICRKFCETASRPAREVPIALFKCISRYFFDIVCFSNNFPGDCVTP